jgi:hypothetical protein
MKKITLLFLIILFAATYSIQAQKSFAGEIRYETKIDGTDDPNLLAGNENQIYTVSILGNKSKMVMKPNEMVSVTQIWNGDKETSMTVIELPMGKYYKKLEADEFKEKMKFIKNDYSFENDFKTICDYKCQKVAVTTTNMEDDSQTELILYVTKEIGTQKLNGDQYVGLDGFPLMITHPLQNYCDECVLVLEATKITPKKIKDVDFLLPDDAKNIDESPEIKEMLKGAFGNE